MKDNPLPADLLADFPVRTEAQYKAFAHPLRVGILRLLIEAPHTNEELAMALGIDSGNCYFHLKHLLAVGFVRLVGTRQNRAITEKLYRAVARNYKAVSPFDLDHKPPTAGALQTGIELLQNTAQLYPDLFNHHYTAVHITVSLTPEKADWLVQALNDLVRAAVRLHTEEPGPIPLSLTGLIHALPTGTPLETVSPDIGRSTQETSDLPEAGEDETPIGRKP